MKSRLWLLLKFVCIVYLITVLPKAISIGGRISRRLSDRRLASLVGVENLVLFPKQYELLKKLTFAIVCDEKSVDKDGKASFALLSDNRFNIKKVFYLDDVKKLKRQYKKSKILLYDARAFGVRELKQRCRRIDSIFVDVQHDGSCCDHSISFLKRLLEFSAEYKKKLVILDRPNLLGGAIEGPGRLPWRFGLTFGELALYLNKNNVKKRADVTVVPLRKWRRGRGVKTEFFDSLVQKTAVSLSLWEWRYFKRLCWRLGLHCYDHDDKIRLCVKCDINRFSAFNAHVTLSRFLKHRDQERSFFKEKFYVHDGSQSLRKFLNNEMSFAVLKKEIEGSMLRFYDESKHCCLYEPLPFIIKPEIAKI